LLKFSQIACIDAQGVNQETGFVIGCHYRLVELSIVNQTNDARIVGIDNEVFLGQGDRRSKEGSFGKLLQSRACTLLIGFAQNL
jgi:hypothetical protein